MLKALIFDFDGIVLDTETPLVQSWREVFDRYHIPIDAELLTRLVEISREPPEAYLLLEAKPGTPIDRESVRTARQAREAQLISQQGLMPGVESILHMAAAAGLKTAIASSSSLKWITPELARLGLSSSFHSIRAREDVDRVKPDPELYLTVLADLRIESGEAIAFEDSPVGAQAARRAGVACVAVPNPATAGLAWGHVDLMVPSLDSVTLDLLAALVSHSGDDRH
jgi:HAD superfamily hydrolase (TIGR01509 family)